MSNCIILTGSMSENSERTCCK